MKKSYLFIFVMMLTVTSVIAQNQIWAVTSGSTGAEDHAFASDIDNFGNSFTGGTYEDTLVIDGIGHANFINDGSNDGFIVKYDENGAAQWVQTINGPGYQEIRDIVVNKTTGDVYVSGVFQYYFNIDNIQQNSVIYSLPLRLGNVRSFVAKFDANGNLVWSNNFFGPSEFVVDGCYSIAIAPDGNSVYVVNSYNTDIQLETGELFLPPMFSYIQGYLLTRLSASTGNLLAYRNDIGRYLIDGYILTCDDDGNVIFAGSNRGSCMFDVDNIAFPICVANIPLGDADGFIWKMDADFNSIWGKEIIGSGLEIVSAVATDAQNNIYAYGTFSSSTTFDANILNPAPLKENAFLVKLTPAGTCSYVKGFSADNLFITNLPFYATADPEAPLAVDNIGNAYIGGSFTGTLNYQGNTISTEGFPTPFYTNGYVLKVNNKGNIRWGQKYAGSTGPFDETAVHGISELGGYVSVCGNYPNYNVYLGDSIFGDQKAFFLSAMQDCDITINVSATSLLVNAANPVTLSTPFRPDYNYQWQRNNIAIIGATSNTHVTTLTGNYKCVVTTGSCVVTSKKTKLFLLREAGAIGDNELIVYPNPAVNTINIELPDAQKNNPVIVNITDLSGRLLYSENCTANENGLITIQLNNNIASGAYLLQVADANSVSTTSIIIE